MIKKNNFENLAIRNEDSAQVYDKFDRTFNGMLHPTVCKS